MSLLKLLTIALILMCTSAQAFAQDNLGLPDIHSDTALNDLHFPKEKWGEVFLETLYKGPLYLSKDEQFDILPAPANDSETTKQDLEVLRKYMKENRDEETLRMIVMEADMSTAPDIIFSQHGLFNTQISNQASVKVLKQAVDEAGYFILREKMHFSRARPTQLAPDIALVIDIPQHASYPSGHGGQSYMAALVLSEIDPENKDKYMQLAHDIGQRREIAGVHYPTDTAAGQSLATQVFEKLKNVPEFMARMERAKETFVKPEPKE